MSRGSDLATDGVLTEPVGIGVDEETALVIDASGAGTVLGEGSVYLVTSAGPPAHCVAGDPLVHTVDVRLQTDDTAAFPGAASSVTSYLVLATNAALVPASPY